MQLQDYDESDRDENNCQVDEHHETADALGVGAERIRRRHGLHHDASLSRVVGQGRRRMAFAALRTHSTNVNNFNSD